MRHCPAPRASYAAYISTSVLKKSDRRPGPPKEAATPRPVGELSAFRINLRFLAYLAPRWRRVVAVYVVMLLGSGTLLAIPQLVRWIVDHGIARDQLGRGVARRRSVVAAGAGAGGAGVF